MTDDRKRTITEIRLRDDTQASDFRVPLPATPTAIANGCTAPEIQDLCLLVATYCGVPAANEAHRIANEVLAAHGEMEGWRTV